MATVTPNLNLELPLGTENVSRQLINSNNTKIDTFAGDVQEELDNIDTRIQEVIDDTAGAGDTDKTWSADKSTKEVTDLKDALSDYKAIIGGTYTFDGIAKGWATLPYYIKAGKTYKIKNIGANNIAPVYSKTGSTNIETIVDAETNLEPLNEITFTAQYDADSISAYFKGNSGNRGLQVYQTDTFVENAVVQEQRENDIASLLSCMANEAEGIGNSTLLGTSSYSGTYWSAIPNDLVYSQTGVIEFELENDADSVFLSLNQTNSGSTRLVTLLNNIPVKAGKYRFVFLRTSNTNYVEMRVNGSVPSVTLNYYDTDKNHIAEQIKSGGIVRSSDYLTKLPDLNSAADNTAYVLFISTSGYPANLPIPITGYSQMLVITYRGTSTYKVQVVYNGGVAYTRVKNGSGWTAWESFRDYIPHYYKVDSSYTDGTMDNDGNILYSSLAKAIEEAVKYPNSTVKVNAGTYNIISEYQTLHPDDWSSRNDGRGINLNNGIKLIFSSKAVVECKYTGDDTSVMTNFSAFNVRFGDAEIINANIDASNVRYCVHDDMFSSATPYHVRYADCTMKIDNSGNTQRSKFPRCIGGGFGQNAHIDIINCVFEGIGGNGTTNPAPDDNAIVDWHNGPNASQKSNLFMNGCYFKGNGTFAVSSNGTATEKSQIIVSGNSFGSALIVREPESGKPVNIEVVAFNNEVRGA